MSDELQTLKDELNEISSQIHKLQALINFEEMPSERVKLKKELRELQYQALFYIEKIDNLT